MKKKAYILLIVMLFFSISLDSVYAKKRNNRHQDIMKGVVIGAGTAIIGAAIVNELSHHHKKHHRRDKCHECRPRKRRPPREVCESDGYWKIKKVWIEEEYDSYWVPGHYNRRGHWVPGRYKNVLISQGYWKKRKIWVESPCYPVYGGGRH